MSAWGPETFDNDAAADFINDEIDRHVRAIDAIFADANRFMLDEDAEGELIPRVVIITLLCEHCSGSLAEWVNAAEWKVRYLAMYDEQIDDMQPSADFKAQRRAVLEATFDRLIAHSRYGEGNR